MRVYVLKQFEELAEDNTSGATELIHRLVALCETLAFGYSVQDIRDGFDLLDRSQRSMPSFHAVLHILRNEFLPTLREGGENEAAINYLVSLQKILDQSGEIIAVNFLAKFDAPVSILTFSRSSTVSTGLKRLAAKGLLRHLSVLEARPMYEGLKTLRDCQLLGVPGTLFVDAAMNEGLSRADCCVIGADSVSADGFLLNKTGSHPLALCCRERGVPLYVLCDSLKFSPQLRADIPVEDRPDEEVVRKLKTDTFTVWNKYFEWVPVELISAFITERGVFSPDQLSKLVTE